MADVASVETPSDLSKPTAAGIVRISTSPQARPSMLPEWSKLQHGTDDISEALPIILDSHATVDNAPYEHLVGYMRLRLAASDQKSRWAIVVLNNALADAFEKHYLANAFPAAAKAADSLQAIAGITAEASLKCHENVASQLFCRLCGLHNRLAVQMLQRNRKGTAAKGLATPSTHVPLLRRLIPALAAVATKAAANLCADGKAAVRVNYKADAAVIQNLRRFWSLAALLDDASRGSSELIEARYSVALGTLAAETPELALVVCQQEDQARIAAEFRPLMQQLGPVAAPTALEGVLQRTLPLQPSSLNFGNAASSSAAILLAGAMVHATRACMAPLRLLSRGDSFPFASLLRHVQALPPESLEYVHLSNLAHGSFTAYVDRLTSQQASYPGDIEDDRLAAQAGLASGLLPFLMPGSYESGHQVAAKVAEWLQSLLLHLPWLQWHLPFTHDLAAEWDAAHVNTRSTDRSHAETLLRQVARHGAAVAPHWTAAVHQQTARSPDLADGITRAVAVVTEVEAGAKDGTLTDAPASLCDLSSGKAEHVGRIRGMIASELKQGRSLDTVAANCLGALQQALRGKAAAADLTDAILQGAAAVVVIQGGDVVSELLVTLAWAPARQRMMQCAQASVSAWLWIAVGAPQHLVAMIVHVLDALRWSAAQRCGIFNGVVCLGDPSLRGSGTETSVESTTISTQENLQPISAQHICIVFLLQTWRVCHTAPGSHQMAAAAAIQRGLLSLCMPGLCISHHPAATGAVFRLALLILEAASDIQTRWQQTDVHSQLRSAAHRLTLLWFVSPPMWHGSWTAAEFREQAQAVEDFAAAVDSQPESSVPKGSPATRALLRLLLQVEAHRLRVWSDPIVSTSVAAPHVPPAAWALHAATAWQVDPRLALALRHRFPGSDALVHALECLVLEHASEPAVQSIPEAAILLATPQAATMEAPQLQYLGQWAAAPLLQATALLAGASSRSNAVRQYAIRSLSTACSPEEVSFFLPQLVQQLRHDRSALMENFLLEAASRSPLFAHLLICALKTEGQPPKEAFNPTVKRSGWKAPQDTGLWAISAQVQRQVWERLPPNVTELLQAELSFFEEVTSVSGRLYEVDRTLRKVKAAEFLRDVAPSRPDLYLPIDPKARVLSVIPSSATPMQSAAKVPILVAFNVERQSELPQVGLRVETTAEACIFKVGDDCRQDVMALQVIGLLKDAFEKAGLDLYLAPYGVLPTDYECGIVQVVPNCASRSALGETTDGGLRQIFTREFGPPGSPAFESARHNFLRSQAGYAIACYLLQIKDRHNGNIMVDKAGHLIHIDFGFLLEISPGGNLGFESAPFKFSHEMTQLLDPSGKKASLEFDNFEALCIRGYLAARGVADGILATVELMADSGLPCFGRGAPVANLRRRFNLSLTDQQAAKFMQQRVRKAYNRWTTGFYDVVQYIQNNIPK